MRYYTLAISGATAEQEKRLAEVWRPYGWWHGVSGFWLLKDHTDLMSAASLRDTARTVAPQAQIMVLEVQPITWAGITMDAANREWLKTYWPPEGA